MPLGTIARVGNVAAAEVLWDLPSIDTVRNQVAICLFSAGSYLLDPACKSNEFYWRMRAVDTLHADAGILYRTACKTTLVFCMAGSAGLAIFTSAPGVLLLAVAIRLQTHPYIYMREGTDDKILPPDGTFTLLSWNICCVGGGKSICSGGVVPRDFRLDAIVDKIVEKDADVNCLYEVFDERVAYRIQAKLRERGYHHFYFNIGPRAIGASSGMFVASKYAIQNPAFTPFPQEALAGTAKYCGKGVFAFDLYAKGRSFARIHATHLNHSDEPEFPTPDEVEARRKEFQILIDKVDKVRPSFDEGTLRFSKKTWGGDQWCARLSDQRVSSERDLDYTMVLRGSAGELVTDLVETGYDSTTYKEKALSDHHGLHSRITANRKCIVITGDLNLDREELAKYEWFG